MSIPFLELTKAVALDEISSFRPKWNQSRALDYLYYSGIASAKVSKEVQIKLICHPQSKN